MPFNQTPFENVLFSNYPNYTFSLKTKKDQLQHNQVVHQWTV
ncbi:hypothetical protein CMALT430_30032 [Carnobacterium maltaromaticum]|nr:hypothetical protein CMALT430_30032 [Carnobacterium maltaromaticum]